MYRLQIKGSTSGYPSALLEDRCARGLYGLIR
jgi:hypothetical protein